MSQTTINQRLKFLIEKLAVSARAFSEIIGEKATNTQNYVGTRQLEPKREYLAKVLLHFSNVNPYWLLAGEGEPFLPKSDPAHDSHQVHSKNFLASTGNRVSGNLTQAIGADTTLSDCENKLAVATREIEFLRQQLELKDRLLESKEEMLTLLRSQFKNPN